MIGHGLSSFAGLDVLFKKVMEKYLDCGLLKTIDQAHDIVCSTCYLPVIKFFWGPVEIPDYVFLRA